MTFYSLLNTMFTDFFTVCHTARQVGSHVYFGIQSVEILVSGKLHCTPVESTTVIRNKAKIQS